VRVAFIGFSLSLLISCATIRHPLSDDLPVYTAVISKLTASDQVAGMRVAAGLRHDSQKGCSLEDRDFLTGVPSVSPALIEDYCARSTKRSSLAARQRSELNAAIPKGAVGAEPFRDLAFSTVGYDELHETALVFLRRQVARECDVGEYFILKRSEAGWVVAEQLGRWIS
jgi:hypothetical protein